MTFGLAPRSNIRLAKVCLKSWNDKRDKELIQAGTYFYCEAHLCTVPVARRSPDQRYCIDCYSFLLHEWDVMKAIGYPKRLDWLPADDNPADAVLTSTNDVNNGKRACNGCATISTLM